jgi:hypothetical protein
MKCDMAAVSVRVASRNGITSPRVDCNRSTLFDGQSNRRLEVVKRLCFH